jgi:hypothetical protein
MRKVKAKLELVYNRPVEPDEFADIYINKGFAKAYSDLWSPLFLDRPTKEVKTHGSSIDDKLSS